MDLAGEPRGAGDVPGEIEQILFLLAGRRKLGEILGGDDDVAGRAGHLALARPFERLAVRLGEVEQPLAGRAAHFLDVVAVGGDEADQGHAAKSSWRLAAASIRARASASSAPVV